MRAIERRIEKLEKSTGKGRTMATLELIVAASWEPGDAAYNPEAERRLAEAEPSPLLLLLAGSEGAI